MNYRLKRGKNMAKTEPLYFLGRKELCCSLVKKTLPPKKANRILKAKAKILTMNPQKLLLVTKQNDWNWYPKPKTQTKVTNVCSATRLLDKRVTWIVIFHHRMTKFVTNVTDVTLLLHKSVIWINTSRLSMTKSSVTNVNTATCLLDKSATWTVIFHRCMTKLDTPVPNVTLLLEERIIWGGILKRSIKCIENLKNPKFTLTKLCQTHLERLVEFPRPFRTPASWKK